ncbi:HsdM family class I SAM-dependent methyltransferase [Treponema sp.]|uniref:HsdM family class I SAM-dependent methyltransferase n=1 Tax=Treponema sp. TaxID=166 RepID=UPI003EFE9FCD
MTKNTVQSVEPNIADLVNGWLKSYKIDYKLEQENLNASIDKALDEYKSKQGGTGGNRPDCKLLAYDSYGTAYPVLIEYKGYKDRLVKLDENGNVAIKTSDNKNDYKNINSYAVNGAVHYANALLHYTDYEDIISIGVTGWKDESGKLQHEIGVYYVSGKNYGYGQEVAKYTDLSFLKKENFDSFVEKVKSLNLTEEEKNKSIEKREQEISSSLVKLNNDIYKNESGLGESARIYLVAASIIANLGIKGENPVKPLEKSDLKSSAEKGERDGDIMLRKINTFLTAKNVPEDKKNLIIQTFSEGLLTNENINKPINGESQLKRVFSKVIDDLGLYYKIGLTTDFTGRLFNEMYNWLGFTQDKLNDVVLTPSYVATFLARLARVNKDSYVWDFATGSAGLLVAAMNIMIDDAKANIKSPDEFKKKEAFIKANQLLGLEILPQVYMLAILNMILMGDGSSNILNKNSLTDFNGNYGFVRTTEKFPATAFVLNPPYSASGNGMVFVEKALSMMEKGYAAIIIQNSAGSGKAVEYNKKILKHSTLLASIKMPIDLFVGKSSVQTNVYVFRVGEAHQKDEIVRFIDFSNDGYTRTNRKKASINLRDTDNAKGRYEEVVNLVRFGKSKLKIFTEKEYYESTIDPENGADWNQSAPVDTKPTLQDFKKTVADYLAWEVSNLLKNQVVVDQDRSDGESMPEATRLGK